MSAFGREADVHSSHGFFRLCPKPKAGQENHENGDPLTRGLPPALVKRQQTRYAAAYDHRAAEKHDYPILHVANVLIPTPVLPRQRSAAKSIAGSPSSKVRD